MSKSKILTGKGHEAKTETPVNGDRIHWTLEGGAVIHMWECAEGLRISTTEGSIILIGQSGNSVIVQDSLFYDNPKP